jgi:hypothetical protein
LQVNYNKQKKNWASKVGTTHVTLFGCGGGARDWSVPTAAVTLSLSSTNFSAVCQKKNFIRRIDQVTNKVLN